MQNAVTAINTNHGRREAARRSKMDVLGGQMWSLCQQPRSRFLLLCKQMLMMGFPCADKQAEAQHSRRPTISHGRTFSRLLHIVSVTWHTHTRARAHPWIFPHSSSSFFSFFFLNSSLFSARVYFYPSVHGRSQRSDEAWETCSSPWQLYS